jgi:hypothetical protein
MNKDHSLNYYFLNKYVYVTNFPGYRQTIINLIINKNRGHKGSVLFVKEKNGFWGLPRQGVVDQDVMENIFETVIRNIGEELGFKGLVIRQLKPKFILKACLFNVEKQEYSEKRAKAEKEKNRPTKGKVYNLVIMDYFGPNNLPVQDNSKKIEDYKWITPKQAHLIHRYNLLVAQKKADLSLQNVDFHKNFIQKIMEINYHMDKIYSNEATKQKTLF